MNQGGQNVEYTAQTPHISLEIILFVFDDFGGEIERGSDPAVEAEVSFDDFGDSKIANLDKEWGTNRLPSWFMKMLRVLKSLWTIFFECKYCNASSSCLLICQISSSRKYCCLILLLLII